MKTITDPKSVERFKAQKAVRIRTAEGRSASTAARSAAAKVLKARYAGAPRAANG
jgi:hypothetical protein